MAKLIPNANCWIGYTATLTNIATTLAPTVGDISGATVLTPFVVSINASASGNTVPTPALDSLFETSISGSVQAQFTADFYRDDTADTAWTTLERGTDGFVIISRRDPTPTTGDVVEVWPITITARTPSALASNTAQTFTVTASCPREPSEGIAITAT